MRVRYTLDETTGQYVARDGTVLGRITAITLEQPVRDYRVEGSDVDVDLEGSSSPNVKDNPIPQTSLLPDPVDETWELYITLLERPRMVLTPKYREWIKKAHDEVGPDMTRQAIRGLAASKYHRDNGYVGIDYAIVPKQRESMVSRIEKMAAFAPKDAAVTHNGPMTVDQFVGTFPAERHHSVRSAIDAIDAMMQRPDDENAVLQGNIASRRLRDTGYKPIVKDRQVVGVEVA